MDLQSWPLVRVRFPPQRPESADFERFEAEIDVLLANEGRHAMLVDAAPMQEPISARWLVRLARFSMARRDRILERNVGTAIVLRAAGARGVLSAYYWMTGDSSSQIVPFDDVVAAERWCRERLAHAGDGLGAHRPPRFESTHERTSWRGEGNRAVELHGPVVDMFREPAFIVDGFGNILLANDAARRAYPHRPTWLAAVVSDRPRASVPDCRVMSLDDARNVFLVIPCASLRPPQALTVEAPSLPPSLERIARLLALGRSDKEIATELELPLVTVRTYVTRIYRKLGVSNRTQLARVLASSTPTVWERSSSEPRESE